MQNTSINGESRISQGHQPQTADANLLFGKHFAKNCMKMKEIVILITSTQDYTCNPNFYYMNFFKTLLVAHTMIELYYWFKATFC